MIEPTETESKQSLDSFVEVMKKIYEEAKTNPDLLKTAPHCTPVKRLDAVNASVQAERTTYLGKRMTAFEHDNFKCTVCGRSVKDNAVLDTVEDGKGLKTVCLDCKAGKTKEVKK
ncbi:hypothetical protein LCGC14_2202670, partial [marine sediment metagenome]